MEGKKWLSPIMVENSKVPVWLSKVAPIEIWAISIGFFVWCRGEMNERTRRHETIHYRQQLELLFVFQWILYGLFFLIGLVTHRSGKKAYRMNPFEVEAYNHDSQTLYLYERPWFQWRKYLPSLWGKE